MASDKSVRIELSRNVLTITLDDMPTRNAITPRAARELSDACRFASLDAEVRVVVLTGAGTSFCSGGNFKAFGQADPGDPFSTRFDEQPQWNDVEVRTQRFLMGTETTQLLHRMGKPTIALMRGSAAGAGIALAAACDFRIAIDTVSFVPGYLRLGLSPDFGASFFVTQIIGSGRAREFFMLRDRIDAAEALEWGLVNELHPAHALDEAAFSFAARLAEAPPLALRYAKEAINAAETGDMNVALSNEARGLARCFTSVDYREASLARAEKREPRFTGR